MAGDEQHARHRAIVERTQRRVRRRRSLIRRRLCARNAAFAMLLFDLAKRRTLNEPKESESHSFVVPRATGRNGSMKAIAQLHKGQHVKRENNKRQLSTYRCERIDKLHQNIGSSLANRHHNAKNQTTLKQLSCSERKQNKRYE